MKPFTFGLCLLLAASAVVAGGDRDPEEVARALLRAAGDEGEAGYHDRLRRLGGPVRTHHDLPGFAAAALGSAWSKLEPDRREAVLEAVTGVLADFYAERVAGRAGATCTVGERAGNTVRATIRQPGGSERTLEFRFSGERVLDVSVDGRSFLGECVERWSRILRHWSISELPEILAPGIPAQDETAAGCVRRLQGALILAMRRAKTLGYDGRHDLLSPVIESTHDLSVIALTTLRRDWKGLSTDEKREFLEVFRTLSLSTYAARFNGWSGETFDIVAEEDLPRDTKQVKTVIVRPGKPSVRLDYVLRKRDGRWLIVNVLADGVSDLALKRAEYGSVMEREGFTGLAKKLREQIARHEAGEEK